jgi:hypothetical protein
MNLAAAVMCCAVALGASGCAADVAVVNPVVYPESPPDEQLHSDAPPTLADTGDDHASPLLPVGLGDIPHLPGTSGVVNTDVFMYLGRDGSTVLDLLLEYDPFAVVEHRDDHVHVHSINHRTADDDNHNEFWVLNIDGIPVDDNPSEIMTSDGQVIEWRIAHW